MGSGEIERCKRELSIRSFWSCIPWDSGREPAPRNAWST